MGKYNEQSAIVGESMAKKMINSSREGRYIGSVQASTMIPKEIDKRPDLQGTLRFIRKKGRIIPIRVKNK